MLDLEKECDTAERPLGRFLLGFEVESPDKRRTSLLRLIDRTLVDVARVLSIDRDRLDEDDRHRRRQLLEPRLVDHARLRVPARTLHEQTAHVGALAWRRAHVFAVLFGHVALQAHLVQRPLVLARHLSSKQRIVTSVFGLF